MTAPQDSDNLIRAAPPDDPGTPAAADLTLWRPYRFKPGDRVACNCGPDGFRAGTVCNAHAFHGVLLGSFVLGSLSWAILFMALLSWALLFWVL